VLVDKTTITSYLKYAENKFGKEFWLVAYGETFKQSIKNPGA